MALNILTLKEKPKEVREGAMGIQGNGEKCSRQWEQQAQRPWGRCVLGVSKVLTLLSLDGSSPHSWDS